MIDIKPMIQDILPEGLSIMAGKSKVGKSVFALNVGLAVSGGKDFLNRKTEKGDVLYITYEDGDGRRLQDRVGKMITVKEKLSSSLPIENTSYQK